MSEPKPLNPTEQDALVKQIGLTLMRAAPEDWRHVTAEYRATGRYFELAAEVRSADGTMRVWSPPQEVAGLFSRLRAGMYREGRGSWSNARYQLDHPSSYNLDFDRAEPVWQTPPPPQAYVDEMRFFPRADENVPEWLRRRLVPQPAPQPAQAAPQPPRGFRTARVFDGAGPGGRPSVNRPPIPEGDHELLLAYLDRAPVAVIGRGFDADVLNPDAPAVVPVAFQTDGHWIWPAAVGYYLRAYGVPPEPELVERAKANDYLLPEVPEDARVAAAANLGAPAAPRDTALPVAEVPEPEAESFEEFAEHDEPVEVGATVAAPLPELLADAEPEYTDPGYATPQHADHGHTEHGHTEHGHPDHDHVEHGHDELDHGGLAHAELGRAELGHGEVGHAEPEVAAPADVERTANLTEIKPEVVEFAQDGPPYRVRFEDDGPVIDDRYRRESYVDGMDLFAPARYDRELNDTQAWSPFADEGPEPEEAEETAEVTAIAGEPVLEEPSEEEPDLADVPVAEVSQEAEVERAEDEPEETERTTEFEVDQDELFHEQSYTEQPYTEQSYTEQPTFAQQQPFAEQQQFGDQQFADQQGFGEQQQFSEQQQFGEHQQFGEQGQLAGRQQFAEQQFGEQQFTDQADYAEDHSFEDAEPGPAVEPRQVTPEEERELSGVRRALDDLDVPPAAYRFGEPVDRTWLLRTEGQDWEVSWFDHGPTNPVRFDRVEDAAAYLIGKLVLTGRRAPRPLPPPPPRNQPQRPPAGEGFREEPPRPPANDGFRDEQHRPHAEGFRDEPQRPPMNNGFRDDRRPVPPPPQPSRPEPQADAPKTRNWPISPMSGEPPLTLFRHKQMIELPTGMEVDRFGDGSGNLVYAAGTPFAERSLVPSWINRPYRVYRLRRPVEVLTGVAVPWFEQPGGGTAYLLPKSVEDMLAEGVLVEVANQEAPTH
ncbi:hypothetical protein FHS29_001553 [Saccharothrix tamanrassetensis]|uniref:TNT domain-containing protein n=1 Tax=Saccharothrix tamanrassetensis TaxID=1051531 RepID=A0A841CDE7_9PSEU|nr:TNT domain-containing protein [Saccharothrix tamanrassetensis]MBB5954983.1 hypothetical protein [Saccharothrix tamanrassetensis]